MIFSSHAFSESIWYESKVVEVSTRSNGALYVRTELNPNPKPCASNWAGAKWNADDGTNNSLAASIALSSKALDKNIKFTIDLDTCGPSGMPVMKWIQQQ